MYDTFTFAESKENKIDPVIAKFNSYCSPKKNVTYKRYLFFSCSQNGRPIDVFVTDLRTKAKSCEFGTLHDSLIRDRIVCGIDNKNVRQRLLRNNELTLEAAINDVRVAETSKTQTEAVTNPAVEAAAVNINSKNKKSKQARDPPPKIDPKQSKKICGCCGFRHKPRECRAYGQTCKKCQGKNHFAHVSYQKPKFW